MIGNMLLAYKLPFKTSVYGALSPDISGYLNFK
jgi:hypothetical protein